MIKDPLDDGRIEFLMTSAEELRDHSVREADLIDNIRTLGTRKLTPLEKQMTDNMVQRWKAKQV